METIRRHIIFKGRVQGVGFRYRASYAARSLNITGWVRNEDDGTVEMEAQGSEAQINRMLSMLNKDSYIRIENMDITNLPVEEKERGFKVKGY